MDQIHVSVTIFDLKQLECFLKQNKVWFNLSNKRWIPFLIKFYQREALVTANSKS